VDEQDRSIDVALRLKAALWLAGRPGKEGTREDPVVAMTTAELAQRELLVENDISRSKLDEILRLRRQARPMELRVIAEALGIPLSFLASPDPFQADDRHDSQRELAETLEALRQLVERLQAEREGGSSPREESEPSGG
jgi:transcriptional regulator with XRE-family HTH domain